MHKAHCVFPAVGDTKRLGAWLTGRRPKACAYKEAAVSRETRG